MKSNHKIFFLKFEKINKHFFRFSNKNGIIIFLLMIFYYEFLKLTPNIFLFSSLRTFFCYRQKKSIKKLIQSSTLSKKERKIAFLLFFIFFYNISFFFPSYAIIKYSDLLSLMEKNVTSFSFLGNRAHLSFLLLFLQRKYFRVSHIPFFSLHLTVCHNKRYV